MWLRLHVVLLIVLKLRSSVMEAFALTSTNVVQFKSSQMLKWIMTHFTQEIFMEKSGLLPALEPTRSFQNKTFAWVSALSLKVNDLIWVKGNDSPLWRGWNCTAFWEKKRLQMKVILFGPKLLKIISCQKDQQNSSRSFGESTKTRPKKSSYVNLFTIKLTFASALRTSRIERT